MLLSFPHRSFLSSQQASPHHCKLHHSPCALCRRCIRDGVGWDGVGAAGIALTLGRCVGVWMCMSSDSAPRSAPGLHLAQHSAPASALLSTPCLPKSAGPDKAVRSMKGLQACPRIHRTAAHGSAWPAPPSSASAER
eukprot:2539514-Rhodomonas_salina.1